MAEGEEEIGDEKEEIRDERRDERMEQGGMEMGCGREGRKWKEIGEGVGGDFGEGRDGRGGYENEGRRREGEDRE